MFDGLSNWMFLKFMAVSDKISKEILSLTYFKALNLEYPYHCCREAPKKKVSSQQVSQITFHSSKDVSPQETPEPLSDRSHSSSPATSPLIVGTVLASSRLVFLSVQ